jgi:hypothetical protein
MANTMMYLLVLSLAIYVASAQHTLRIPLAKSILNQKQMSLKEKMPFGRFGSSHGVSGLDVQAVVELHNYYTLSYTGPVKISSQTFNVVFDTGSADFWVFSARTQQKQMPYLHYYNRSLSSTYVDQKTTWEITYGGGNHCEGYLGFENVFVGGLMAQTLSFAETVNYTADFQDPDKPLDGIVGLGFIYNSVSGKPTLFDQLKAQGQISKRIFSFHLQADPELTAGAEFLIGEPDRQYAPKGFTWVDLIKNSAAWAVPLDSVYVGSEKLCTATTGGKCSALIDSGTSLIGVPGSKWDTFYSNLVRSRSDCKLDYGKIFCNTSTLANLPSVSFGFKGREWALHPNDYQIGPILGFMRLRDDMDFFILGDTFMKTHYVVFDQDGGQIGFANPPDTPT